MLARQVSRLLTLATCSRGFQQTRMISLVVSRAATPALEAQDRSAQPQPYRRLPDDVGELAFPEAELNALLDKRAKARLIRV